MSRIQRNIQGTSYNVPTETIDEGRDLDTADRVRDYGLRGQMHETREADMDARNQPRMESHEITWRRPMSLEAPPPRPGMAQRWVRVETRSETDRMNLSGKMREGWRPRDPKTVPGCEQYYSVAQHAGADTIRVGGLVLFEIDERVLEAKKRAIRSQIQRQEESVRMETAKISADGVRQGFSPIERDEKSDVSTGRRPPTLTQ